MTHLEIRNKFLEFFKKRGHGIVPSSSLIPKDSSVLLTTAGMQQFKPYYTGEADAMKDFGSLNTVSIQKCLRTSDIDEVGDESHLTFFEMLGNFSFGGYFKEEAIKYGHEFITKEMGLKIGHVSIFGGDNDLPSDVESENIWKSMDSDIAITKCGRKDNFWGPTGDEGPCGPTSEIYVNDVEVWNLVFNQYYQKADKTLISLKTPGIDTGMGLERLVMAVQRKKTLFETDIFDPLIRILPHDFRDRIKRIIVDHIRSVAFLSAEGVIASNKDQGYVLRRLMRRVLVYEYLYGNEDPIDFEALFKTCINIFSDFYPGISSKFPDIFSGFDAERSKFHQTLGNGIKMMKVMETIDAYSAFQLFSSYGLPFEIIKEIGGESAKELTQGSFDEELRKHQELSRTASAGMFKGGLADTNDKTIRLHTTAHLMLEALRRVLGGDVRQKGSNITSERLRFDFSHNEKMTPGQIKKVEDIVNRQIQKKLPVNFIEMTIDEAKKIGATGVFERKYGEKVKVYFIGKDLASGSEPPFSREICGGPHVSNTSEIGGFKIIKEEAVSAGVRRIKAVNVDN